MSTDMGNIFWNNDPVTKPISFEDLKRLRDEPLATETSMFLGVELPWEFSMPTVVTGVPRGFDLYELALDQGGRLRPDCSGAFIEGSPEWRAERLRALHWMPALTPLPGGLLVSDAPSTAG